MKPTGCGSVKQISIAKKNQKKKRKGKKKKVEEYRSKLLCTQIWLMGQLLSDKISTKTKAKKQKLRFRKRFDTPPLLFVFFVSETSVENNHHGHKQTVTLSS